MVLGCKVIVVHAVTAWKVTRASHQHRSQLKMTIKRHAHVPAPRLFLNMLNFMLSTTSIQSLAFGFASGSRNDVLNQLTTRNLLRGAEWWNTGGDVSGRPSESGVSGGCWTSRASKMTSFLRSFAIEATPGTNSRWAGYRGDDKM